MIFLLMAFLYLGTCQASNESASLSNDVGKSLRHWIAPSLSSSAGDELNLPEVRYSMMPADSAIRVMLIGPSSACAGQVITLTAVVENNYLGEVSYQFRRNGNYITEGVDPVYKNRIQVTVPDLGGLDSLIQEYDVTVTQGCHTVISPVHYLKVNSINVLLDSVLVCDDDSKGLMCAQVFSNNAEAPYSFVWYQNGTAFDTTYTPCKLLPVGDAYSVEPHFTWNGCVAQSNEAKVKVGEGPADDHLKLDGLTAVACNGNQVVATLSGLSKKYGQPSITWTLNGHTIYTAHDSVVSFSPLAIAGDATDYILKATVSYANYDCKEYTTQDTISIVSDPTVAIYGDAVICGGTTPALTAVLNGSLTDTTYIWKVDGVVETTQKTSTFAKVLSQRNYPYEISLIVTDSASCTAVSEPFMLYVDTANTVKLLSSVSTVCKNDGLVTLAANVANTDIPGLTYQWSKKVGDGAKSVIDNAITSTYTTTLTDTTKFYVAVTTSASSCTANDSVTINVYKDAPAVKPIVLNTSNASICDGGQVMFTLVDTANLNQYPGAIASYQWIVNGVELPLVTGTTYMATPVSTSADTTIYNIRVVAQYTTECSLVTASVDTVVKAYRQPSVSISGDPIVCDGAAMNLTANVHNNLAAVTYLWKVDGVDSTKSANFTAKLKSRDYPYAITVITNPSTACEAVSDVFYAYVGANANIYLTASADSVCKNGEVTLTTHIADGNMPGLTYSWKKNGVEIPGAFESSLTATILSTDTFRVAVQQNNTECVIDTVKVIKLMNEIPADHITMTLSDSDVCSGAQVMAKLNGLKTNYGAPEIIWSVNGIVLATNNADSIYISPDAVQGNATSYLVNADVTYANYTCTTFNANATANVVAAPEVEIYGDAIVCNPTGKIDLSAVVTGAYNGKYTWRVDGVDSVVAGEANYIDTLPTRDYPYEITVALNDTVTGCTVISGPFMVYVGSNPVVEVTVSADTVCQGNEVVVTANVADINTPGLTYTWSKKDADDSTHILGAFGPSVTYAVEKDTKFFVHIQQNHTGCTAYGEDSVKVYEKALPVKPIALEVSNAYVCYGGQIEFTVIDTANRKQYYNDLSVAGTYAWFMNGVRLNGVSGDHFTFSPSTVDNDTTNYLVEVVASYELQCETLTATIDTTVTVQANPTIVISGDPIVCDGSALNLLATVHDTLIPVIYKWRVDGVDSTTGPTFTSVLDQRDYPYNITVVVNEGTACEVISDVYQVLIGINPTVEIGVSAPIVCKNDEVTLTAHLGDYNMPNLTYQWYEQVKGQTDTTTILVGTSRELTIPVTDTTKYMVKVSQVNSECFAWADTVIYVYPKAPAVKDIELVTSQAAVCFGGQIEFTVIDTANRKQYFGSDTIPGLYQWYKNGVLMPLATTDHYTFSPDAVDDDSTNYLIEVVATYVSDCETLTTSVDTTVTAYPNPTVVIAGDPFVCDTNLVKLVAIVSDTLISPKYLWRVDGADSLTFTTDTFETELPYRDYPYEISVVVNQGSACEVVSEPYLVYVDTKPVVVVTADYDTVCHDQVVTLTAHLGNYNQENLTYQWYADEVAVPEGTESTLAYTITNTDYTAFKVVVTQLNSNCQGTGFDTVVTAVNPQFDTVLITNLQDDIFTIVDGDTLNYHRYYNEPAYDVCEGASVQITAYMKDASGNRYIDTNVTYNWKRNGVEIEGVHGAFFQEQLSILDHDLYKYIYTVEIAEPRYPNCYAEPVSASSDTLRVRRNPTVIIGGQQFVCYQGPSSNNVLLQAWVNGAVDTGAVYRWYRDGQFEENPVNANRGAIFTGMFPPRYGYNYTFQVEVITGSGCSSISDPYEVTVMAPPVITITPSADTVCRGGSVALVSHLDDYNVLDYELQYQWYANELSSDNIVPGATEPVLTIDVDETTNYIVGVEYLTENLNRPFCIAADTMTVTVYDRPQIDSIIMSLTEVCEGSQVELTAVMNDVYTGVPNVPYVYEWYRNSELLPGNAATIYDSPVTVDGNEQQYNYSVIVYQYPERMMCESPLYVSSQTLTVYPNPIVAISGDQHVCHTDTIILSANSDTISNPVGGLHYYWFESGAPIDNLNGDSAILKYYGAAQDEPYRFTVQVERDNASTGCRAYSYEYDVYVYESPVVNVTVVDENVCEGAEVTVTAHLNQNDPEQTNLEFQWFTKTSADADYVLVPGATALTYTTTIFDTTEFMFKVVHTLTGCFDTDSKTINTLEIPVVTNITLSDTTVCEGSAITITAFIDSTKGIEGLPYFYEWRRNGELMPGNTNIIHDTPMTVDGTTESFVYSAIAYQTPERLACTSALTESAPLIVLADPRVAISGDQTVCHTDHIILNANVDTFTNVVGGLHYTWYESGNMIENLNGDSGILDYVAPVQNEPYRFTVQIEREDAERGCRAYSEEYDVYVMDAPEANVTIVDEYVCAGAEVTVTAHLDLNDPEQTNLEYQWYTKTASETDFTAVPGATAMTYTTTINETTEFMFKVVNTLSECFDTDSKTINVQPIPVVNYVSMSDTNICEGAQVTIYADVEATAGVANQPYFFEWRRNGELLEGNTQTITDSPVTVDGNEQSFVYSVIAYQTPERLACYSQTVESAQLNVYPNPRVAISGDQYVCETDSVFLYANVDTIGRPVGLLHYTWYESGRLRDNMAYGLADSRFFSEYFYPQDEPYRFTVEVQRDDIAAGCRSYSEEFLVWVYKQPVVNITASETTVCEGGEVTLRANLNNYEFDYANDAQYQWYTVDTVLDIRHIGWDSVAQRYIDDTLRIVEHNAIPGATMLTYNAVMTEGQVFGFTATHNLSGCSDYDELAINVLPRPIIDSIHNVTGKDTICPGGRVELVASVSGGVAGGEEFIWTRNGIVMETIGNTLIDYPMAIDNDITKYVYAVVVRQAGAGCVSELTELSQYTMWVVPNPTVELAGDPIVCDTTDNNIVITANVVNYLDTTGLGLTYQWYENNAALEGETGLVLSVHRGYRDYPYSFNFAVQNEYGCTVNSEPFLVYVNDNPVVHISATETEICTNGVVTLSADLYDQNADNLVYQWYINNEPIEGAFNPTYTTALTETSTFKLYVHQRDSHCAAYSNEVTVNVNDIPVVTSIDVLSESTEICEGHVVTLKANISGGVAGGEVYTWYKDNEIVSGVTGDTYTDYPMTSNNAVTTHVYNVTVAQTAAACESVVDAANAVSIKVIPNPSYTIFGDASVCEPINGENNITLEGITNDPTVGTNPTYTWYEAGVEIAGQNTSVLSVFKAYREEPYIFKLIVTNAATGCTSETAEFAVSVSAKPMASIVSDQDSICAGGFVTLTSALVDSEEARLTYQWQSDANGSWENIQGAITPVYVTPALNATTNFRLHVTNLLTDCENNSNEVTVTVKSAPVVAITNINTNIVCNGGEVVLKATQPSEYQGLGEVSYQWFNNGQAIEGANSATYTTSPLTVEGDMTTYTFGVQVTMTNSGCVSNVAEEVVTAYADPTVVVTYNNGLTLCEGGQTVLTANPDHAYFTDFDYQWFFQGQPIQGANEATYTVENLRASQNPYEYAVEVKVNNGTTNGCSVVSEPVYVNIVKDPTAYITVNEGVNAICEGGNVTFTVNVNDGVADTYNPYTYEWTSNVTGEEILGTDASFTTSTNDPANLYVYYVNVASAYGCSVTVADTLRIVEDPSVTVSVKLGADQVVCEGGFTTLIATVEGGLGEASYQWYKNGYAIEGANSRELVTEPLFVNQAAAYTVSVAQSGIACTATSTQFNVPVYEAIEVALTANSEVNCVGGSVILTATANNGIPGDQLSYQWYRNGNPINGANAATYTTDDNLIAGLYEYQVEVASSISGCHVAQSGTIGITVEAEPTIVITSNAGNSICEGGDITLTANVIYATNATQHNNVYNYTWKWYEGTTLMSYVSSEPHYTLPATMTAGTYNFFVEISSVDGLGCDATSLANNNNFFTVVVKPVPSVILTASSDASCEGGDVTFNAVVVPTNLTGAYYWNVNGTTTVSNSNSITVNNMVLGTNNISVVFTPNDAQVACGTASVAITHTVNAAPVVTVAATDNNRLNMCVGGTIAFNATATGTANASDNYVWTVDGQTQNGNNGTSFSTQMNTPGIHTVSAMVERTMGCSSQFSTPVVVVVAEQPVAQLTQTAGYTEMCTGGEITLMAKVANYATVNNGVTNSSVHGTYTYSWNRDNANIQTTTSTTDNSQITETLNADASYSYSVTITPSGFNCQAATATLDHSIIVVPDPSWSVNQVNPSEMCLGGIVTLNAEVTGGVQSQQAGRIQWYKTFNGVESEVSGLGGSNTDVPEAAGVYTYAPKYIDYIGAGCNIADAIATQVTVNALPTAQFTSGHGSVICAGDYQSFATLEITLTGTAPYTFTIMNVTSGESQTIVTSLNPYYYNVNPTVTSIYRIISVSDANGCIGTLDNVADVVVNVSDITVAASSVIADCETWIARIPLHINAATSNTFVATLPNGATQTGTLMFDSYTQMHYAEVNMSGYTPGAYNVTITVDGCSGQCVVNVPANDASFGDNVKLVDQRWDDVVVVNNNPANNGGYKFSTYQWYRNGELIPGATEQYYQEEGGLEGFYACELNGVMADGTRVHFITCEKYFSGHASIRVYPVPATTAQDVTIELNLTDEELDGAILDIYDVKGAHIRSLSNLTPITKVGNFGAQGTYFGRIITGTNEIKTVKFIIVK